MAYLRDDRRGVRLVRGSLASLLPSALALLSLLGCHLQAPRAIAVIPRTSGTMLWEPEHVGATDAARAVGRTIYWNAPTREDDVAAQIALVEHIADGAGRVYEGLVLTPDQANALITPVRRAEARGLPIVVVSSPLTVPPGDGVSYILNDEEEGGRLAAERVGFLLHGKGSVAVLGINPDIAGIMDRARSFERALARNYPLIQVVDKRMGSFNVPREQQVAEEMLRMNPGVDVIVALMWASARGAMSTIGSSPKLRAVKVIGFDPEVLLFEVDSLDSVILQNTRDMAEQAVLRIDAQHRGEHVPVLTKLAPVLVTRANVNASEIRRMISMDWQPSPPHSDGSTHP